MAEAILHLGWAISRTGGYTHLVRFPISLLDLGSLLDTSGPKLEEPLCDVDRREWEEKRVALRWK